jgi:glycosyltransferase involved in cell wall biosynthesis
VNFTPRVLVVLPQLPHDPASGAARTLTAVGEVLAASGFEVFFIGTTATEGHIPIDVTQWLQSQGLTKFRRKVMAEEVVQFTRRRVECTLLDVGARSPWDWAESHGATFDRLVDDALVNFRPHFFLTFGGSRREVDRQHRARRAGARVVFGLYNASYLAAEFFDDVDEVITPSIFLSQLYLERIGLKSSPLTTPLWQDEVLSPHHERRTVVMVNPAPEKGQLFFARLVELLGREHPEIPVEVFPSRTGATEFVQTAWLAGVDLSRHPNLLMRSTVAAPHAIYANARLLLAPSLVADAAPRVIAEAFVNGVPPIGSNRGGIPEMCADAGFILPVSGDPELRFIAGAADALVRPWLDLIVELFQAERTWQQASDRALREGAHYLMPTVAKSYVEHFERMLGGSV